MLYIFDKINLLSDDFPENKMSFLSEKRRNKVKKIKSPHGKKASAVVYLLLRLALRDIYGINEILEFDFTKTGKPVLQNYPNIHFSLSHSFNVAVCAVSDKEIGVDVQQISNIKEKVAKRVLADKEFSGFINSLSPDEYFCDIWTKKESFLKLTGQGIATELREIRAEDIKDIRTFKENDYFYSVCGAEATDIEVKHISITDLIDAQF